MMQFHDLNVRVTEQTYQKLYKMAKGDYRNIPDVIDKIICEKTETPTKNSILNMLCERQQREKQS